MAVPAEAVPVPGGESAALRRRLVARLAAVCAALLLVVIVASAYLRLANAGLGCADWPACYGRLGAAESGVKAGGTEAVRMVHRLAATSALLVIVALVGLTWMRRPLLLREGGIAASLLAITLVLAVLGWIAGSSTVPAVVLANLLGGFTMLALAWRLYGIAAPAARLVLPARAALRTWTWIGTVLLVAEIVVGGLVSADFAARSCTTLPACGETWWPGAPWTYVFDLLRDFAGRPLPLGDAGAVALHMIHRGLAVATALVLGIAAFRAIALPPGLAILGLLFIELILGAASVGYGLPLSLVILHNLVAALLLAAAVALLRGLAARP